MSFRKRIAKLSDKTCTAVETPVYSAAIGAYSTAVRIAASRLPKARRLVEGHKKVWLRFEEIARQGGRWIWIHASSLGEFEQGRPLIERIRREKPGFRILLTFFSPSGYEVRKGYQGADAVAYLPFDFDSNARRFLDLVKPEMAFFIKYEFWRNYLRHLHRRGIPTYLVSGIFRESQLFFKPVGIGYRKWLGYFTHLYVQDENSRRLLGSIGIRNVTVAGDTRFDRVTDIMRTRKEIPEVAAFTKDSGFTLCIGSSWQQDEKIYFPWLAANPAVKAVIAPHEFDEARIRKLLDAFPGEAVTLSQVRKNPESANGKRILIIDCFGLLSSIYGYCDAAWIGGAFGSGLHNINEAAVYGIPVIFGPRHGKFIEAGEIIATGGGFCVEDAEQAAAILGKICSGNAFRAKAGKCAGEYIKSKLGATDIIFRDLF